MDEVVKLVSEKAHISNDQAKQAVEAVMGFLKDRLPAPVAAQVNNVLGGQGDAATKAGEALGGMFGGKKA